MSTISEFIVFMKQ